MSQKNRPMDNERSKKKEDLDYQPEQNFSPDQVPIFVPFNRYQGEQRFGYQEVVDPQYHDVQTIKNIPYVYNEHGQIIVDERYVPPPNDPYLQGQVQPHLETKEDAFVKIEEIFLRAKQFFDDSEAHIQTCEHCSAKGDTIDAEFCTYHKQTSAEALHAFNHLLMHQETIKKEFPKFKRKISKIMTRARFYKGVISLKARKKEEALKMFGEVIKGTKDADVIKKVLICRAVLYEKEKRYLEAIRDYNNYLKKEPTDVHVINQLGNIYFQTKQFEDAESFYEKSANIDPKYYAGCANTALSLKKLGKLVEALKWFNRAIEIKSTDKAFVGRGCVLKKMGSLDAAVNDFNYALKINPKNTDAYRHRAKLYFMKGDYLRAKQDYQNMFMTNPPKKFVSSFFQKVFFKLETLKTDNYKLRRTLSQINPKDVETAENQIRQEVQPGRIQQITNYNYPTVLQKRRRFDYDANRDTKRIKRTN